MQFYSGGATLMRFVTETRLKRLEELIRSIPDPEEKSHALHLLDSIRNDIDDNYAEIEKPIGLSSIKRMTHNRD